MSAPVNIAMQAQRRLLSEIVSAVQVPSTQLELWVYMTTTANPFELVRATSLGLLREAVRKALEHEVGIEVFCGGGLLNTRTSVSPARAGRPRS